MATKEIPIAGYEAKLLSRVEVAEGTGLPFRETIAIRFQTGAVRRRDTHPILRKLTLRETRALFRSPVLPLKTS